jgi:hypothetical protein
MTNRRQHSRWPVTFKGVTYESVSACVRANPGSWTEARRLAGIQMAERVAANPPLQPAILRKPDPMPDSLYASIDLTINDDDLQPFDVDFSDTKPF